MLIKGDLFSEITDSSALLVTVSSACIFFYYVLNIDVVSKLEEYVRLNSTSK